MNAIFFKDTSFAEATSPKINPKNNSNSILQCNKKPKGNFNVGGMGEINPSENNTIL